MEKLIFGKSDKPAKERKKKQEELNFEIPTGVKGVEFELCADCSKVVKRGFVNISKIMPVICDKCRYKFMLKANKEFVIGGLVRLI